MTLRGLAIALLAAVVDQGAGIPAPHRDAVDVLCADHREIERLLAEVQSSSASPEDGEPDRTINVVIAELARHIVIEEEYLYPLAHEAVRDGGKLATEGLRQGMEAERVMKRLETSAPPARAALIDELADIVRRHVRMTEADLFPALRRNTPPDQLEHLAGVMELARRTAPTHAHPGAPHSTPWNQILAPGIGLIDRVRDLVTGRPTRPEDV